MLFKIVFTDQRREIGEFRILSYDGHKQRTETRKRGIRRGGHVGGANKRSEIKRYGWREENSEKNFLSSQMGFEPTTASVY